MHECMLHPRRPVGIGPVSKIFAAGFDARDVHSRASTRGLRFAARVSAPDAGAFRARWAAQRPSCSLIRRVTSPPSALPFVSLIT